MIRIWQKLIWDHCSSIVIWHGFSHSDFTMFWGSPSGRGAFNPGQPKPWSSFWLCDGLWWNWKTHPQATSGDRLNNMNNSNNYIITDDYNTVSRKLWLSQFEDADNSDFNPTYCLGFIVPPDIFSFILYLCTHFREKNCYRDNLK